MSREINFRAWDKKVGIMREVYYIGWARYEKAVVSKIGSIANVGCVDGVELSVPGEIDSRYLMQYTGLKDKNGKEIYEGDICKTFGLMDNLAGEVVFDDYSWMLWPNGWKSGTYIHHGFVGHLEVIGNIYENPELLEKNEKNEKSRELVKS